MILFQCLNQKLINNRKLYPFENDKSIKNLPFYLYTDRIGGTIDMVTHVYIHDDYCSHMCSSDVHAILVEITKLLSSAMAGSITESNEFTPAA